MRVSVGSMTVVLMVMKVGAMMVALLAEVGGALAEFDLVRSTLLAVLEFLLGLGSGSGIQLMALGNLEM